MQESNPALCSAKPNNFDLCGPDTNIHLCFKWVSISFSQCSLQNFHIIVNYLLISENKNVKSQHPVLIIKWFFKEPNDMYMEIGTDHVSQENVCVSVCFAFCRKWEMK